MFTLQSMSLTRTTRNVLWEYSPYKEFAGEWMKAGLTYTFIYTYDDYMKIKALPTSWSMPYAGRLKHLQATITFPVNTVAPLSFRRPQLVIHRTKPQTTDGLHLWVAGSGSMSMSMIFRHLTLKMTST